MSKNMSSSSDEFGWAITVGKVFLGVVILFIVYYNCHVTVSAGHTGVETQFGAATGQEYSPGFNFKLPWKGVADFNTQIQLVSSGTLNASSSDLQGVSTTVEINYQPKATGISWIFQNIGTDYANKVIIPAIPEAVKAVTAQYTASQLVTQRAKVKQDITNTLSQQLAKSDIIVNAVNITNFDFSDSFNQAIEAKQVAQQAVLTAQQNLDQARIDQQKTVVTAQANAQAAIDTANGAAQAVIINAKAAQEAQQLQTKSLNPLYLSLQYILHWNGQLPQYFSGGNNLPFFTIPLTGTTIPAQ